MAKKKRVLFCSLRKGEITVCDALDEVLEFPNGQGTKYQGLKLYSMVSMDTMEFSRNIVVIKSGQHAKKGLIMNFCPFCREELNEGAMVSYRKAVERRRKAKG